MSDVLISQSHICSPFAPVVLAVQRKQTESRKTERHSHERGQLIGSLKGAISVCTDQGQWIVPPINAIWLPPHVAHWFRSHGAFNGWSVYVANDACTALPQTVRVISHSGLLQEAVARAATWTETNLSPAQSHIAKVILDEIALTQEEPLGLPMPSDPRLQKIARALADDPAIQRTLQEWAAWSYIAPRTLSRRFVLETGLTFRIWRQRLRLHKSLEMLIEGRPVTTVAFDLGYDTVSAFIELFREHFGTTPGCYQKHSCRLDRRP